ncbi:MAG TPA: hypothetical protein PKZ88_04000 [Methanothermobacter sp.]|nr:hypothetical protein [Methanothermobacter sp.]
MEAYRVEKFNLASHLWNPFSTSLGSHAPLVKEQGYKMDLWKDI